MQALAQKGWTEGSPDEAALEKVKTLYSNRLKKGECDSVKNLPRGGFQLHGSRATLHLFSAKSSIVQQGPLREKDDTWVRWEKGQQKEQKKAKTFFYLLCALHCLFFSCMDLGVHGMDLHADLDGWHNLWVSLWTHDVCRIVTLWPLFGDWVGGPLIEMGNTCFRKRGERANQCSASVKISIGWLHWFLHGNCVGRMTHLEMFSFFFLFVLLIILCDLTLFALV